MENIHYTDGTMGNLVDQENAVPTIKYVNVCLQSGSKLIPPFRDLR